MPQSETTEKCRWSKSCREPPAEGRAYCEIHLQSNRLKAKRHHQRHRGRRNHAATQYRLKSIALGRCVSCAKPASNNTQRCAYHQQEESDKQVLRLQGGIRTRCTKHNPDRHDWIVRRLKKYEPYLNRDWSTAEPWIRNHIELWAPHKDNALFMSVELKELTHMFNVYLDGCVNYLENGMRLGSYIGEESTG